MQDREAYEKKIMASSETNTVTDLDRVLINSDFNSSKHSSNMNSQKRLLNSPKAEQRAKTLPIVNQNTTINSSSTYRPISDTTTSRNLKLKNAQNVNMNYEMDLNSDTFITAAPMDTNRDQTMNTLHSFRSPKNHSVSFAKTQPSRRRGSVSKVVNKMHEIVVKPLI